MSGPVKWEAVQESRDRKTLRLAVPGGWLYLVIELGDYGAHLHQCMSFVPKGAKP